MKLKFLFSFLSFAFCILPGMSQVPQGYTYQAIARDISLNPILNTSLPVTITIQSDSLGGNIFWEELHPEVKSNGFGLITLIVGQGIRQDASEAASFGEINWGVTPKFIKTQVFYKSELLDMGFAKLWSVPYAAVAGDLAGSVKKLEVAGNTNLMDEALFEVKNKDGKTVFAVYNEGVRIFVGDGLDAKGAKGGFAVGSFDQSKGQQDFLVVNSDSIRAYIDTNPGKGKKGGFAVGGFDQSKEPGEEYLRVTRDSTRIYLNNKTKGKKGGFAVGGFDAARGPDNEYLRVTTDSVKVSKSLLIPRLTTEERDNLPFTPGEALIIFNMTESCMQIFKNNVWSNIWCFNCAPDFIIQPVDQTICSSENAIFFISATGTSLSYQWQQSSDNGSSWYNIYNGGTAPVYSGCNGYSLSLTNIPVSHHNYKYRCVVSGSCLPNVTSNVATLNVGSAPALITAQPADQQLSGSCTASFSIVSPGYGVSYKWQESINGGTTWNEISDGGASPVFSGSATSTLNLSNVPMDCNNNKYRCTVSNLCGSDVISNTATLTILPTSITAQPSDQQLTTTCGASFSITTPNGYTVSYQWQVSADGSLWANISDGGTAPVYSGVTSSILSLSNVPLAYNNYKYRCSVSSLCGPNETSNAATITIDTSSPITVQPVNKLVYAGQNITIDIVTSGSGINYQWQESTNGGSTWLNLTNGGSDPAYTGVNTSILSISKVPVVYNTYEYRCTVSHYCRPDAISDAATLAVPTPVLVTDIDGNTYNTVGIGSQLWMAENLKTTRYNNGDSIGTTTPATLDYSNEDSPRYQWASTGKESNVAVYGRLYTWYAANDSRSVCPTGWHVPTDGEWTTLTTYLGESFAGGKLKETGITHWVTPNLGATNETGFTALASGFHSDNGGSGFFGVGAFFWSSTKTTEVTTPPYAYHRNMWYERVNVEGYGCSVNWGLSIRCVKDE
jgi:uncharacterized protein (TIGR02145 family)